MNVADPNLNGNPDPIASHSPEQLCRRIDEMAEALKGSVKHAAAGGDCFDSVERSVRQTVFEMGKHAVDLFVSLQGDGDLGDEVASEDDATLRRSCQKAMTTVRSVFGTHQFRQFTYAPGTTSAL